LPCLVISDYVVRTASDGGSYLDGIRRSELVLGPQFNNVVGYVYIQGK
jgi:hypothetical protein